ncbi:hypothetical protein EDD29_0141 [Actinocorallia herbida]|uniref:Uncharacterized protein n=1 Tax=Actinocorallia herbida TaxID=58109 RepID=A0A3N1CMX4_9ACTN|nr:hypothetical protein [Actinocorallia herbida]ROO82660.1 hypothetical protein EDD29_0141 [Actinocorallia herbida]
MKHAFRIDQLVDVYAVKARISYVGDPADNEVSLTITRGDRTYTHILPLDADTVSIIDHDDAQQQTDPAKAGHYRVLARRASNRVRNLRRKLRDLQNKTDRLQRDLNAERQKTAAFRAENDRLTRELNAARLTKVATAHGGSR